MKQDSIPDSTSELSKLHDELAHLQSEYQRFVYCVSHDLGAPLRQIEGFASLIEKRNADDFDDKTLRHFSMLLQAVNQAQSMLDALTFYSRIDKFCLEKETISLEACIRNALKRLQQKITVTQASVVFDVEEDGCIYAHDECICRVCFHLIDNALNYVREGGVPSVQITLGKQNDMAVFSIADEGIGIADKFKDKVFEMFQRQVSSDIPGLGAGLTISKKIIERHGGTISLSDNVDGGSIIHILIPLSES
jgi:light-regulated signal transduction histidine kinase (bacteriophytochrome)